MAVIAPRIASFAPQLLVDDLERAIAFYRDVLGFTFGPPWQRLLCHRRTRRRGASPEMRAQDGRGSCEPAARPEHLDIYGEVVGVASVVRHLQGERRHRSSSRSRAPAWGTRDFYVADPDGYILAFGESDSAH